MCLAILDQCRKDIKKCPSKAEDCKSNPRERRAIHYVQRALNKMNSHMELSECQVAADLLNLPCKLTSDPLGYTDPCAHMAHNAHCQTEADKQQNAYQIFEMTNDKLDAQEMVRQLEEQEDNNLDDCIIPDEGAWSVAPDEDDESHHLDETLSQNPIHEQCDVTDKLAPWTEGNVPDPASDDSTCGLVTEQDQQSNDRVAKACDQQDPSGQQNISDIINGFGWAQVFTLEKRENKKDDLKITMPIVAHHNERGEALRNLSRCECDALVQVDERNKTDNPRNEKFPFSETHPLAANYEQSLQQKHRTLIFCKHPPRHPGRPPETHTSSTRYKNWLRSADEFARYYLTAFRPEPDRHRTDQQNPHECTWAALQEWMRKCKESKSVIAKFRLQAFHTQINGLRSSNRNKVIAANCRARNRDHWDECKRKRNLLQLKWERASMDRSAEAKLEDEVEFEKNHKFLSRAATNQLDKQLDDTSRQMKSFMKVCDKILLHDSKGNHAPQPAARKISKRKANCVLGNSIQQ